MKKALLAIVIIGIAAVVIWKYPAEKWLDKELTSDLVDQLPTLGEQDMSINLTQFVPADTVFYLGGRVDKAMYDFMAEYPVMALSASERATLHELKAEILKKDSPQARFIQYLIDDYSKHNDGSYQQFVDYLGLAGEGEYAFYLHGLVPVLNTAVEDRTKLISLLKTASAESGLTYQEQTMASATVLTWQMGELQPQLMVATTETSAILSFAMPGDQEQLLQERLGLTPVASPFTDKQQQLRQKYGYTEDMLISFSLDELAKGLFKAEGSTLAADIERYIPQPVFDDAIGGKAQLQSCKTDILGLVANAPQMVMGYRSMQIDGQQLQANTHGIWEINNAQVMQALKQLQGTIPQHVLSSSDKLASLGIALDMAQLAPAATSLWEIFTSAEFSCKELIQAQKEAQQFSPMMLGMVTGMAQGLKGLGLSVFDVTVAPESAQPVVLDAALSVETTNPAGLLSLLQLVPELAGLKIPLDGSEVPLALPLPFDLGLKAAVKGEHVVVYAGDKGQATMTGLATEKLTANGLGFASAFNYRKAASLIDDANVLALMGAGNEDSGNCIEAYAFIDQMRSVDIELSYRNYVSDQGLAFAMDLNMAKPETQNNHIDAVGRWQTAFLDETCQWLPAGIETISAEGTGRYVEQDKAQQCELYHYEYIWQQRGKQIAMTDTKPTQFRDSCVDSWQTEDNKATYYCEMMNITEDSFQCLYHGSGDEPFVYQYQRMN